VAMAMPSVICGFFDTDFSVGRPGVIYRRNYVLSPQQ
jgi:hypothetical protein